MKVSGKEISELSNEKVIFWLRKTSVSVGGYQRHSSGRIDNQRAYDMVDRYCALSEEAKSRGKLWQEYCDKWGICHDHDEYDNFA